MKYLLLSLLLVTSNLFAQTELYKQTQGKSFKLTKADKDSLKQAKRNVKIQLKVDGVDRDLLLIDYGYDHGKHFRGAVHGDPNSTASMSVLDFKSPVVDVDSVMGQIISGGKTYSIAYRNGKILTYDNADLPRNVDECQTSESYNIIPETSEALVTNKVVRIYFECDYAMFQKFGTEANTRAYVSGLFNQVATLYQNEGLGVVISEIKVWTTLDPYASALGSSNTLQAFRTAVGTGFNGDLAHLLTTRGIGGGIAYVNVLCGMRAYAFGVSMVYTTYATVPTYSWSVQVVAHELGHQIGSPHTQSCSWTVGYNADGTPIKGTLDDCYASEGGCVRTVVERSTIMSYCHTTSYGIDFSKGFGDQPGDLIRSRVMNATCLTTGTPPVPCSAPTNFTATDITQNTATVSWTPVTGALGYTLAIGTPFNGGYIWTQSSKTTTTVPVSTLTPSTTYKCLVKADCSGWSDTLKFTTLPSTANCASVTGLSASATCYTATIKWNAVSGATSYTVTINGVQHQVTTTTFNATGLSKNTLYTVTVKPNCTSTVSTVQFKTSKGRCR